MNPRQFVGTGVAMVTPFNKDLSIDFQSLSQLIEHLIEGGVDYLVALGTTAESVTLSKDEKQQILNHCVKQVDGRLPLVAGFGGNNTQQIISDLTSYNLSGVDAVLSVSPAYNKPSQEGIIRHFRAIAETSELPIILYNVPSRTSSNMQWQTTISLAECSNQFIAVKEASGDLEQCMELVKHVQNDFLIISGDDLLCLPMLGFGIHGVISVIANAFPTDFSNLIKSGLDGNFKEARTLHYKLMPFIQEIFSENNPAGIKYLLNQLGVCANNLRLPLVPLSLAAKQRIDVLLNELNG